LKTAILVAKKECSFCLVSCNMPYACPHTDAGVAELRLQAGVTPMSDIALKVTISIRALLICTCKRFFSPPNRPAWLWRPLKSAVEWVQAFFPL
jgi:hypothetical protein